LTADASRAAIADGEQVVRRVERDHRVQREPQLSITSPPAGAVYLIDPTLRREFQTLPLRVTADRGSAAIEWAVDGASVGSARADGSVEWPLVPGDHRVTARDRVGHVAETRILVK
jgi:penicillin-binding protein 1C